MTDLRDPRRPILHHLGAIRTMLMGRALVESLAWIAAAAGVVLVLSLLTLAAWTNGALRLLLLTLLAAAVIVPFARIWGRDMLRFRDPRAVAAFVERSIPAFRTDIRTALDEPPKDAPARDTSSDSDKLAAADGMTSTALDSAQEDAEVRRGLRARLLRRVELELSNRASELPAALPSRPLEAPMRAAAGAVLALAALLLIFPDPFAGSLRVLVFGIADSAEEVDETRRTPLVESFDLRLDFPQYTGIGTRWLRGTTGDFQAMPGVAVELRSRALIDAQDARLVIGEGDAAEHIALDINPLRELRGRITVTDEAPWFVELLDQDGTWLRDPRARRISIDPDEPPRVELTEPTESRTVAADEDVAFGYRVTDDFGIDAIHLTWRFEGDDERVRRIPLHTDLQVRSMEGEYPLALADLSLRPRDVILVAITARDNDTINGPKITRSREIALRIAAPDEVNDDVIRRMEELFEALLQQLARILPIDLNRFRPDDERRSLNFEPRELDANERAPLLTSALTAAGYWADIQEAFTELVDRMEQDVHTPDRDKTMIAAARSGLDELIEESRVFFTRIEPALERGTASPDDTSWYAAQQIREIRATEGAILVLEDLVAEQRASAMKRTIEELQESRERLRSLLEQYRETPDEELRAQILDEIQRLEARMRELMDRLREQSANLPREHLNMDAMEPNEVSEQLNNMGSSLDNIRAALESGDIDAALNALDALDLSLDQLDEETGGALEGASSDGMDAFQQDMAEVLEELTNLAELERALEQETEGILEEARAERAAELEERADAAFERYEELIAEQRQRLDSVDRSSLGGSTRQRMEDVDASLDRLQQMMEDQDLQGTAEMSERAEQALRSARLESFYDATGAPQRAEQAQRLQRELDNTSQSVRQLRNEMNQLREDARPQLSEQAEGRLQELADEQAGADERMDQLGQRMQQVGEEHGVPIESEDAVESIRRNMQQAENALRQSRPEPALRNEREARQGLQSLRQQMQQMMQQQAQQRRDRDGSGRQTSRERVDIPEDGRTGSQALREQVLDAMREEGVDAYQEGLRRYYESLIQ